MNISESGYKLSMSKDSHLIIETRFSPESFDFTAFLALRNEYRDLYVHIEIEELTKEQKKKFIKELRQLRKKLDEFVCQGQEDISRLTAWLSSNDLLYLSTLTTERSPTMNDSFINEAEAANAFSVVDLDNLQPRNPFCLLCGDNSLPGSDFCCAQHEVLWEDLEAEYVTDFPLGHAV